MKLHGFANLLVNTLYALYECTSMGLVVTEASVWLFEKAILLYNDD